MKKIPSVWEFIVIYARLVLCLKDGACENVLHLYQILFGISEIAKRYFVIKVPTSALNCINIVSEM